MNLRGHQNALYRNLQGLDQADLPADILADVVPGGGKSMLPLLAAGFRAPRRFVPRLSLAGSGSRMLKDFDMKSAERETTRSSRGTGICGDARCTHRRSIVWEDELRGIRTC